MIILISNNGVTVTSGVLLNNQATVISNSAWSLWLNTNANTQFYDQRQGITIQTADLDVGKLGRLERDQHHPPPGHHRGRPAGT